MENKSNNTKKNTKNSKDDIIENNFLDEYENLSENEDIDIEELTSNKIDKSINLNNMVKKLYVILEHA